MPNPKSWDLPPPEHDTDFETLCLELFAAMKRPMNEPNLYGRSGQKQHGVDFVLQLRDGLHCYQCKRVKKFTFTDIEAEIAKTKNFPEPFLSYTILTTLDNDTHLDNKVMALSRQRVSMGLCPIAILFWSAIRDRLVEYREVLHAHYPEITPQLNDLLQGSQRRINADLPGTTLEMHTQIGHTNIVVHPGPAGLPFQTTFYGKVAVERFQTAITSGEPVIFSGTEFELHLPNAFDMLMPRSDQTKERSTLRISPFFNGKTFRVNVVVHPHSKHRTIEMFTRRATKATDVIPAQATIIKWGTDYKRIVIQGERVAVRWVIETYDGKGKVQAERDCYKGASVQSALAAEKLFSLFDENAYIGITGEGFNMFGMFQPNTIKPNDSGLVKALEILVELSILTDWDINLPEVLNEYYLAEAASLLELFQTGQRKLKRPNQIHINLNSIEALSEARVFLNNSGESPSVNIHQGRGPKKVLEKIREFPITSIYYSRITVSNEVRERILTAQVLPVLLEFCVPEDAEVVEVLVETEER